MNSDFTESCPPPMPWHAAIWQRLSASYHGGQLGHALLFHGPVGVGKNRLAQDLMRLVLCEEPGLHACGVCRSCHLYDIGNHPSAWRLAPGDAGGIVGIDTVRELVGALTLTTQRGDAKCAMISPAEAMNRSAANALLKTLEEPPGSSLLILVSHVPSALPATIRSRCQSIAFAMPPFDDAQAWLETCAPDSVPFLAEAEGAPLEAIRLAEEGVGARLETLREEVLALAHGQGDPVDTVAEWRRELDASFIVRAMSRLAHGLVCLKFSLPLPFLLDEAVWSPWVDGIEFTALFGLCDELKRVEADLRSSISLNEQLMLEELAVRWSRLAESR